MSMTALGLVSCVSGESPCLSVHPDYLEVANCMMEIGMPISDVVPSPMRPTMSDMAVFGSSVSRMSDAALDHFMPGYSKHYNCCLGNVPRGIPIPCVMCYSTGLMSSVGMLQYPKAILKLERSSKDDFVVYHFGGSRVGKSVHMPSAPYDGFGSIAVGSKTDPCPGWIDTDMRGASLIEVASVLSRSMACVGSDSLITNLSSLIGVPTVSIHDCMDSLLASNRSVYGDHACSVLPKRGEDIRLIVIDRLARFF